MAQNAANPQINKRAFRARDGRPEGAKHSSIAAPGQFFSRITQAGIFYNCLCSKEREGRFKPPPQSAEAAAEHMCGIYSVDWGDGLCRKNMVDYAGWEYVCFK